MTREIKFRALLNGEWYYSDSHESAEKLGAQISDSVGGTFWNKFYPGMETLGQYIGQKDKNGKEIYEGDVVLEKGVDGVQEVQYDNESAMFSLSNYSGMPWHALSEIEITGNIHQKKQLKTE